MDDWLFLKQCERKYECHKQQNAISKKADFSPAWQITNI